MPTRRQLGKIKRPCIGCGSIEHRDCRPPKKSAGDRTGEYRRPEYVALRKQVRAGLHGPCADCGATDDLTIGHQVPVILGGTIDDGWVVQCRSCNGRLKGGVRG